MMRLIDADALMEFAHNHVGGVIDCNDIARFPTIEAEPVRHGEWIEYRTYDADTEPGYESYTAKYRCSECGRYELEMEPYCNCGAKMDGGKDANMREEDTNERG